MRLKTSVGSVRVLPSRRIVSTTAMKSAIAVRAADETGGGWRDGGAAARTHSSAAAALANADQGGARAE